MLIKVSFFMVLYTQAKPIKLFQKYQNETLLANETRLQEKPVKAFTSNDILNKSNVYINLYPIVSNNVYDGFDASKVGSVPVNDFYARLFTTPNEFQAIQSRIQTTNVGEHQQKETTNYNSKTRII